MTKNVVIIGGGFGGLQAAKALGNTHEFHITLLDRRNYHLFQPLLYQVAMAGLSATDIAMPIRGLLSKYRNINVLLENVERIDLDNQIVISDAAEHSYDYLICACGAKHSYFGHEHWEERAPGHKTLEQAIEIRRRILTAFELAEREKDRVKFKQHLTFVVIGGGPTGVELAGAIGEISRFTLSKDFRNINPSNARIILIEAGDRILSGFDPDLSKKAVRCLEKLGVQVWVNSRVTGVTEVGVQVGEEFLESETVLWAAGVQPSSINKEINTTKDVQGRIKVEKDLSLAGHPNVFFIGDQTSVLDNNGNPLPGIAPVAIQQGHFVGNLLKRELKGKPRMDFEYTDKGQMATIGRKMAVLQIGRIKLWGFLAWLAWLFVHIYYLIGFKNRVFVFIQWTWHYLNYGRGARLIMDREWRSYRRN